MAETDVQSTEITFKTITQEVFKLTLPLTTNIGDIKERIFKDKGGDFEVDRQKLIYNGKVLEDSQTLGDIKVDEKKYIVVMASRKKVEQPVISQGSSSSTAAPQASTPATTGESTTGSSSINTPAPVNPTFTPEQEETITTVCAMGYERDQAIKALRAAFWNADRAVEYLCTQIPEIAEPVGEEENQADVSMEASGDEDDPLIFLRDSPQFAQIAQLVRSAPEMLPQVLEQIAASNPELMQTIRNNQEAFVQMLNQGVTGEQQVGGAEEVGQPPHQAGHLTIAVTEADRNALERLQAMGFAEQIVIEAYFACDKNEDLAVNYILSRMEEPADEAD